MLFIKLAVWVREGWVSVLLTFTTSSLIWIIGSHLFREWSSVSSVLLMLFGCNSHLFLTIFLWNETNTVHKFKRIRQILTVRFWLMLFDYSYKVLFPIKLAILNFFLTVIFPNLRYSLRLKVPLNRKKVTH